MELSTPHTVVQAITRRRPITTTNTGSRTPRPPPSSPPSPSSLSGTPLAESGASGCSDNDHSKSKSDTIVNNELKRKLNLIDIIFYGIGCSVGAGIYSLVGIGADIAGPSLALSFLLCGVACIFTSLSYAEFASLIPLSGSAYTFVYVSFGELAGWLVGWNLTLGYAISAAVVARSWSEYFIGFVQGWLPGVSSHVDGSHSSSDDGVALYLSYLTKLPLPYFGHEEYTCCPLSIVIIGICTLILVTGVKESTRFNTFMTLLNLGILAFVMLSGTPFVSLDNLLPLFPHGLQGVARGSGLVFFSYLGFDMVACLSEEVVDPQRNMPIGIIGSLCASMTIYVTISVVVIGMVPVKLLGDDTPILNALLANACCTHSDQLTSVSSMGEDKCLSYSTCPVLHAVLYHGSRLVSFGAIFGLTTATFACLMGQPRINYAAANDGLIFPIFKQINPSTGIPTAGTIITGVLTSIIACFINLETLANAISLGTLMVFTFVNAGIILLRMRPSIVAADERSSRGHELTGSMNLQTSGSDDAEFFGQHHEASPLLFQAGGGIIPPPPPSPLIRDNPELESYVRALGLIKQSSREVRDLLRQGSGSGPPLSVHDNGAKPVWFVTLFTLSSIVASMTLSNEWPWWIFLICALVMALTALLLFRLPKCLPAAAPIVDKNSTIFRCPFVPGVPLLGIVCNSYMMGSMSLQTTWVIIGLWLCVGVLFYFSYGIHHSELNVHKRNSKMDIPSSS